MKKATGRKLESYWERENTWVPQAEAVVSSPTSVIGSKITANLKYTALSCQLRGKRSGINEMDVNNFKTRPWNIRISLWREMETSIQSIENERPTSSLLPNVLRVIYRIATLQLDPHLILTSRKQKHRALDHMQYLSPVVTSLLPLVIFCGSVSRTHRSGNSPIRQGLA